MSDSIGVSDSFRRPKQTRRHTAGVPPKIEAVDLVTRWTGSGKAFTIADVRLVSPARSTDRTGASRVTKPRVRMIRGRNSVTARVSGLRNGRLEFSVKAEKGTGSATTTVRKGRSGKRMAAALMRAE